MVYTNTHSAVKGMHTDPPPTMHRSNSHPRIPFGDFSRAGNFSITRSSGSSTGHLPKVQFPVFEGDDPKLWITRCENYFKMHDIDISYWYKIASMHFSAAAGRWLQFC